MIPEVSEAFLEDFASEQIASKDFNLNMTANKLNGMTEKLEEVKQAIYFMLSTERYKYLIYPWSYGVELLDLFGQPYSYVVPELERRVRECLTQDERIMSIDSFVAEKRKNMVHATFVVHTIFGDVESEVNVNV